MSTGELVRLAAGIALAAFVAVVLVVAVAGVVLEANPPDPSGWHR